MIKLIYIIDNKYFKYPQLYIIKTLNYLKSYYTYNYNRFILNLLPYFVFYKNYII